MDRDIKALFDRIGGILTIDSGLVKRLTKYETEFTHRNKDHIDFFSGNLLGVDKVRFKTSDWNEFFDEVIRLDDVELRQALIALPTVNAEFKVSSDIMNVTCMWLIHAIANSSTLKPEEKHTGMLKAALIFNYKVLSSKLAHDFPYTANRELAQAVYAELSKKFSLKRHGNWGSLLIARSEDMISPTGIHGKTIRTFQDDAAVLYMVTDSQGRIRDLVKTMRDVFERIRKSDAKILTSSSHVVVDGELEVGDLNRYLVAYKHYIQSVVGNRTTFIKDELVDIIASAMHTMHPEHLVKTLEYISDGYHSEEPALFESLIEEVMIHAFDFLARERKERNRGFDLSNVIVKLRGIYMSSRSTDPYLLHLRDLTDQIVGVPLKGRAASALASVRTGLMLYIVLRALTRSYYSS